MVGVGLALLATATLGAPQKGEPTTVAASIEKGARWLASTQGADGGWGQDGGETSYVRQGVRLETSGNDVANTAVAALALMQAGKQYKPNVDRAVDYILKKVEASPADGLAITDTQGTQIQRKLGPYIDTFLTSMLLAKVDGTASSATKNASVRKALEKTVAKIEKNQLKDGSWNVAGGWAPILGTSMASRGLWEAQQKGVQLSAGTMARADIYTQNAIVALPPPPAATAATAATPAPPSSGTGTGAGVGAGLGDGVGVSARSAMALSSAGALSAAAGVPLYQNAQALEQMTRTPEDRAKNADKISAIQSQLADSRFVQGFGSVGGEEFFSYLNIADSLKRAGGEPWKKWNADMAQKIVSLQNADGTWAGSHCITGRVAVTGAAILNLTLDDAR
jgi:hypothetical protein